MQADSLSAGKAGGLEREENMREILMMKQLVKLTLLIIKSSIKGTKYTSGTKIPKSNLYCEKLK